MSTSATKIALNTLSSYVRFGLALGIWFLLTPFAIDRVGAADFGLWTLVYSVVGFFGLLDLYQFPPLLEL